MRLTRLLAVVMTAGLMSGALTWQAAQATAAGSSQPTVGQCRQLTATQVGDHVSDTTAPISCSKPHNSRVIAVPTLPKGVRWRDLSTSTKLYGMAVTLCYPAFRRALGQTNEVRDRTAYTWNFFEPTKNQRHNGQRWIRCDLAIRNGSRYGTLPNDRTPALSDSRPSNRVARCLRQVKGVYQTTPCSSAHTYRAVGTFSVAKSKYPGQLTLLHLGRSRCPDFVRTDTNFRWTWNNKTIWNRGHNHVVVCYNHTQK